jgi:hypothetical protein
MAARNMELPTARAHGGGDYRRRLRLGDSGAAQLKDGVPFAHGERGGTVDVAISFISVGISVCRLLELQ